MNCKLTPRERVDRVLNFKKPDRVPIDIGGKACNFVDPLYFKIKEYLNIDSNPKPYRIGESSSYYDEKLYEKLGTDFRHLFLNIPEGFEIHKKADGTFRDEWGRIKKEVDGYVHIVDAPLKNAEIEDIDNYDWPNPDDPSLYRGLAERAKDLYNNTEYALSCRSVSHGFFELAWELRGMENFMMDIIENKKFANKLLDKILKIQKKLYNNLLQEVGDYMQIVQTADDYGMQNGLLISPQHFREFFKPRRKELNDLIKRLCPEVKIFHHTCGSVYSILDDLIETGIDILNSVQPLAKNMDSEKLNEEYGDKLAFHGGIDEQKALPNSLKEVEDEVKTRIDTLGDGGGYILAPTSNFQVDTPIENVLHMIKIAKEYSFKKYC